MGTQKDAQSHLSVRQIVSLHKHLTILAPEPKIERKPKKFYFTFSGKDGTVCDQPYFWKAVVTNSWNFLEL